MKILTGNSIKGANVSTIEKEPISSLDLMERAAEVMAQWICNNIEQAFSIIFVVGKGNNAGDGLAVARMLYHAGFNCSIYTLYPEQEMSEECMYNMQRLPDKIDAIDNLAAFLQESNDCVVVDAILGAGFKGELSSEIFAVIKTINAAKKSTNINVISIDIPSGMTTEFGNNEKIIINADHTLTIQSPKLSMLLPEGGDNCGAIEVMNIDLDKAFINSQKTVFNYLDEDYVRDIFLKRPKFGHKGTFGHVLLVCGFKGMTGAAILSTGGALRSGCGLVTVHLPEIARPALHANYPSAIVSVDPQDMFSEIPADVNKYSTIGVGCGLGHDSQTISAFIEIIEAYKNPMVIDADALNILALNPKLLDKIPRGSILTPHPKELERIIGAWIGEEEKIQKVMELSLKTGSTIVLKGAHTMICQPDGQIFFNSTGNAGMAKGGSGDVLTGLISGLIARGYTPGNAALLGVYLHGKAGDKCAGYYGVESMNAGDLPEFIAEAMHEIE